MNKFVFNFLWPLFLSVLFLGYWTFVIIGVEIVVLLLIYWLKPEWLSK